MSGAEDKVALITGASGGIGLEMARLAADRGYNLVITGAGPKCCMPTRLLSKPPIK